MRANFLAFQLAYFLIIFVFPSSSLSVYYISDDFSGKIKYFYEGDIDASHFKYLQEDRMYEIDGLQSDTNSVASLIDSFASYEVTLEVQIAEIGKVEGGYAGLAFYFRETEKGASFYSFLIFSDGYFAISQVEEGQGRRYLVPLRRTELINPFGFNELRLKVSDGIGGAYINGTFVSTFDYPKDASGGVGMLAGSHTLARFRNFKWQVFDELKPGDFSGPFGLIPASRIDVLFRDDFQFPNWKVGKVNFASMSYRGDRYVLNNLRGTHLLTSYLLGERVDDFVLSAVFSSVEGSSANGFGVAFCLNGSDDALSYIAFVTAKDGTWKLFKQSGDVSMDITDWRDIPFEVDYDGAVVLSAGCLQVNDKLILIFGVNGELVGHTELANYDFGGGFGLVIAPRVSAEVSSLTLVSIKNAKNEFLEALRSVVGNEKIKTEEAS